MNWTSPAFLQWRPLLVPTTTACFASSKTLNTDQLREQLDHLHKEADKTRAKANNARLRLLRLSEAADKLRRLAAISVHSGKEDDAREMLIQKKKVMQAMEKSKNRIELLDELAAKLNEAITMRETQLIGNVSLDLEVEAEDIPSAVRIVSPKETDCNDSDGNQVHVQDAVEVNLEADNKLNNNEEASASGNAWNEAERVDSLKGISSYEDFLEHIDLKLKTIEDELVTVLRFSGLVIESKEKLENSKIQQLLEIFDSVHRVRER
nr:Vimentin like [Ipomoea batatas]GME07590.1 Vimentin like [Ipomoea batatas]